MFSLPNCSATFSSSDLNQPNKLTNATTAAVNPTTAFNAIIAHPKGFDVLRASLATFAALSALVLLCTALAYTHSAAAIKPVTVLPTFLLIVNAAVAAKVPFNP